MLTKERLQSMADEFLEMGGKPFSDIEHKTWVVDREASL